MNKNIINGKSVAKKALVVLMLTVFILTTFLPTNILANSIQSDKKKKTEISGQIKEKQKNVQKIKGKITNISKEVQSIVARIGAKEEEISKLETDIKLLNEEITEGKNKLKDLKENKEKNKKLLEQRIRSVYVTGNMNKMEMLLSSNSVMDFLSNAQTLEEISKLDNQLVNKMVNAQSERQGLNGELKTKRDLIKTKQNAVEKAKKENEHLKSIKNREISKLDEKQKDTIKDIEKLRAEQNRITASIREAERRIRERIAAEARRKARAEARRKAEAKRKNSRSNSSSSSSSSSSEVSYDSNTYSGIISSPAPGYSIGTPYGARRPGLWNWKGYHTGVDYPCPVGTPLRAASDGIVVSATYRGAYGKHVIIYHPALGISTLYAHGSSLKVSPGQYVKRGQVIMSSGKTGNVTGAHLHFEVRKNGDPINPNRYL